MAELPIDQAVPRFKANEDRFDAFINDATGYESSGGTDVESVQEFLARLQDEVRNSGIHSKGVFLDTATALGEGVAGYASLVGGSSGTNGTFDLSFTGGTGSGAAGVFTVEGGALTEIIIIAPGSYTVAPTFDFSASSGLSGASATCVLGANVSVGEYFFTPSSADNELLIMYRVDAGPVATEIQTTYNSEIVDTRSKLVSGKVNELSWSGSTLTVSIAEGRVYKENNAGTFEHKIAPLDDQVLLEGQGLVVDVENGTQDGSNRYIPELLYIASAGASGWQSDGKYILVAHGGIGAVVGEYVIDLDLDAGNYDGLAAFSTSSVTLQPTWDEDTRTLTWPETILVVKDSTKQNRIKLEAGSIVVPSGKYYVVVLDLDQVDNTLTPNTAVSVGRYYSGGWAGDDEKAIPLFCVNDDVAYSIAFTPAYGSSNCERYDPDEIVINQRTDEIDIFMKGSNKNSKKYLRYRMQRKTDALINSDVWRWERVVESERTGKYTFTFGQQVCTVGENELAIKQTGKSDFMGGTAHGDEELFDVKCLIDGDPITLGGTGNYLCSKIEFMQGSDLFEEGTGATNIVAKAYKKYVFEKGKLDLMQNVIFEEAINLADTYLAMLTLERFNAVQVSDEGYRSPTFATEDIENSGFTQVFTDAKIAKASGPSGYSAEVEITEGWDKPNREFHFSNSATYNKFYFDFTGSNYDTSVDEVISARAIYKLDTSN